MDSNERYSPNSISKDEVWASMSEAKRITWEVYCDKIIALERIKYLGDFESYCGRRQQYRLQEANMSIIVPQNAIGGFTKLPDWIIVSSDGTQRIFEDILNSFSKSEHFALSDEVNKERLKILKNSVVWSHVNDDSKNKLRSHVSILLQKNNY